MKGKLYPPKVTTKLSPQPFQWIGCKYVHENHPRNKRCYYIPKLHQSKKTNGWTDTNPNKKKTV